MKINKNLAEALLMLSCISLVLVGFLRVVASA